MCANDNSNKTGSPETQNASIMEEETEETVSPFAGKFSGNSNGIRSSADIEVNGNKLNGTLVINGQSDTFDGTITGNSCKGIIHDTEVGKEYEFEASINGDQFSLAFSLPELNNQVLTLVMKRDGKSSTSTNSNASNNSGKARNPELIGTWRNNETLSSGSGDTYMSFSTDYFIQLNGDGTALSWTGASAGMTTSAQSREDNPDRGTWYTDGKTLHLVDGITNQDATTLFSVDGSRMMLHNGGAEKKIFERIR